jgi:glutamyl-tRNA synthetase
MSTLQKIRGRFAPSPTGYVHIGSLRVALFNYLFVKKHGGDVILRIEDTDRKRYVAGSVESLLEVFDIIGIGHDEGPFKSVSVRNNRPVVITTASKKYPNIVEMGAFGPYIQSERLDLYQEYAEELVAKGHAYFCFCTPERLETTRQEQTTAKTMPKYDRHCLALSQEEIEENKRKHLEAGAPQVIRFRLPDDEVITISDLVRGEVSFHTRSMSDAVLLKSDGFPTYHLAMAVDDHCMEVSHVIRGEEWLASLPLHALLYRAFGWEVPQFAHLPLILNPDKSKLSKRQGDVAVEDYLKKGYLKEALINFVALLGWNPGEGSTQEIFSIEELIEKFDFAHVHKAGAIFDIKKLDWINAQYIKRLSLDELYQRALPFWETKTFYRDAPPEKRSETFLKKVLAVERERLSRLDEVGENGVFFFVDTRQALEYERDLLRWKENTDEMTCRSLAQAKDVLSGIEENDADWHLENLSRMLLEAAGEKRGDFLWPLRVALTGAKQSPSPFETAWALGKTTVIERIDQALAKMSLSEESDKQFFRFFQKM